MNNTKYIKINSDDWADAGQLYKVLEHSRPNPESTATHLTLELEGGHVIRRVVAYHWIEWIEDGDW